MMFSRGQIVAGLLEGPETTVLSLAISRNTTDPSALVGVRRVFGEEGIEFLSMPSSLSHCAFGSVLGVKPAGGEWPWAFSKTRQAGAPSRRKAPTLLWKYNGFHASSATFLDALVQRENFGVVMLKIHVGAGGPSA